MTRDGDGDGDRDRARQALDAIAAAGFPLDADALLDVLWLADRFPVPDPAGRASPPDSRPRTPADPRPPRTGLRPAGPGSEHPPDGTGHDGAAPPGHPAHGAPGNRADGPPATVPLHTTRQPGRTVPGGSQAIRVPEPKELDQERLLVRSLRPLRLHRPSRHELRIDEPASAEAVAETRLPTVVLRPERERRLRCVLVVDDGVSMLLWRRLVAELTDLFQHTGAFRQVQLLGLRSRGPGPIALRPRPFTSAPGTVPPRALTDPTGQTLVVVVSDGAGQAWRDGRMRHVLDDWGRAGPLAVVHTLPRRLWAGTGLAAHHHTVRTVERQGMPNSAWRVPDPVLPWAAGPHPGNLVPVPVLELTPAAFSDWAGLVAGTRAEHEIPLWQPRDPGAGSRSHAPRPVDPMARFRRFTAAASPAAHRLAAHVAGLAPVSVPVMRLVQFALDPAGRSGTLPLAEVFLGGLLRPVAAPGAAGAALPPNQRMFDLAEEVKQELFAAVPTADLLAVTHTVSQRVAALLGRSPDFPAWLADSRLPDGVAPDGVPFARIGPSLLRHLGVTLAPAGPAGPAGPAATGPAPAEGHPGPAAPGSRGGGAPVGPGSAGPGPGGQGQAAWDAGAGRTVPVPDDVYLSYVPEDRAWADWAFALLADAGYRVLPGDAGAGADPRGATERGFDSAHRTVALFSADYLQSPQSRALWDRAVAADPAARGRRLIPVRISDVRLSPPFNNRNPVDLVGLDEAAAATALLHALDSTGTALPERSPGVPRLPGTRPAHWGVPGRNRAFTGRIKILDDLRTQLMGGTTAVLPPQALHGLGGIGKTQVALEYAHRYMSYYDLVWWIRAEQSENVVVDLADLAFRLGLRVGDSVNEAAQAARDALRRGIPTANWLLIFDNADEPAEIRRYFPDGPGHILVTSRNQGWSGQAGVLNVDVFDRAESVDHLTRRVRNLSRQDADRVADSVGDLPLAVELAAAWLETTSASVDAYVNQLKAEAPRVLAAGETPADYPTPVSAAWNISITRLREQSPAAVRLLELCAFFAPEPISLRLFFFSEQMRLALVPYDAELTDTFLLGRLLRDLSRYALVRYDPGAGSLQVHRLVQAVVRGAMSEAERNTAMHQVHRILVSARPSRGDTDDPANWPTLEEIWPHLMPSGAQDCDEPEVRELLIDQVRYLWRRADLDQALQLGRQLDTAWTARADAEADPSGLRRQLYSLRLQIANVLRSQGSFHESLALDQGTLAGQRELLGEHHPNTLTAANSLAADLRCLNRFVEARMLDEVTHSKSVELFGEDDPRTLAAADNLAVDLRLAGNHDAARYLDRDTFERRSAVLGPLHPHTLASKASLARDLRELGDYRGSIELLREVADAFGTVNVPDLPEELRSDLSLAISLRRAGQYREARELTDRTYGRYADRHGPDSADVLACRLNLAADHSAAGDKETARDIATDAYEGHHRLFGYDHPFTYVCENNLAIYLRGSGDVEGAIVRSRTAEAGLAGALGTDHPFARRAAVNLANALADNDELEEAEAILRAAYEGLTARRGAEHPDAVVCLANLAVVLRATGRREEAETLRRQALASLVELFGEEHPSVVPARGWQRINRDLEPEPL